MKLDDVNILNTKKLISPKQLLLKLPITIDAKNTILNSRNEIADILEKRDKRLFVVVGPCSIHDPKVAIEYAGKLKVLQEKVKESMLLIMRVYFEKPRTTIGWKGLINDPDLNNSFNIEKGLHIGRKLLLDIASIGVPTATEALDPILPQYLSDLVSWYAIGARTTESQTHREMSSGLSAPVGFKNGTDGSIAVSINAIQSVTSPHRFLGINHEGEISVVATKGNKYTHTILRGGDNKPNYDSISIKKCEDELKKAHLPFNIMVDCSHANSNKNYKLQPNVFKSVIEQIKNGNKSINSLMIESNLFEGFQPILEDFSQMKYGVSITDSCISFEVTERILIEAHQELKDILKDR